MLEYSSRLSQNRSPQFAFNEKDQYLTSIGHVLDSNINNLHVKFQKKQKLQKTIQKNLEALKKLNQVELPKYE